MLLIVPNLHAQSGILSVLNTLNISPAQGLAVKGNILYVNPGLPYFHVIDIGIPTSPINHPNVSYGGDFTDRVSVDGDWLYLFGGPSGVFRIFDISNPIAPVEKGMLTYGLQGAVHVGHANDYSYIAATDKIFVVNTSDKNNPTIQSTIVVPNVSPNGLQEVIVHQNALYVAAWSDTRIYDISNPATPLPLAPFPYGFVNATIDRTGQRLYLDDATNAHHVADVSSPLAPAYLYTANGGSAQTGPICYQSGFLLQSGPDPGSPVVQSVNSFRADGSSSNWVMELFGPLQFSITDIVGKDSLFIVSKFGGVEILRFGSIETSAEEVDGLGLEIWPNPAMESLRVKLEGQVADWRVEVLDVQGRSAMAQDCEGSQAELDVSELAGGMYLLRLSEPSGRVLSKRFCKY